MKGKAGPCNVVNKKAENHNESSEALIKLPEAIDFVNIWGNIKKIK